MDINKNTEQWMVIVNPNAGRRKGASDWGLISELFKKYDFNYTYIFTEYKRHAISLVKESVDQGFRRFIVVGGDGTMNEVVNGVFAQSECPQIDITIGMITVGTGNDWGKMFNIPNTYEGAIKILKDSKSMKQDVGIVSYQTESGLEKRHFINIAGLGFDAMVVQCSNKLKNKGKSSKSIYYWALLKSLFLYKTTQTKVIINGHETSNDTFSIRLGIGKFSGGGMCQTPDAIVDDGLFDITIIKRMRKGEIIKSLKKLFDGSILSHPKIESFTGSVIEIFSDPLIFLEVDGESLGHSPIEFNIVPRAINVFCKV